MAKQLDPRMINAGIPLVVNRVVTSSLSSYDSTLTSATGTNIQCENVVTGSLTSTDLNITNNVTTNFLVSTVNTNYTFSNVDNSKVFHFDTTSGVLSAIFPSTISNGFNVALVNTGVGAINLSVPTGLNAPGTINSIQNTGVFIYKHNNQFYGIGVFE